MVAPGTPFLWTIVDDNFASWGGQGSLLEVEVTPKLLVSGEFGVDSGRAHHIKRHDGLGDDTISLVGREVGVAAMKIRDEMILEGLNRPFCKVQAMITRGSDLVVHLV